MARPLKEGLDYFPLDVDLDIKFELIEAEYGLIGFGVVVKLFQLIYGKCGYYVEWTDEVALLFAKKNGVGGSVVSEIITSALKRGMFDKDLYDKYQILTSAGIQKRYFEVVGRRKKIKIDKRILLVNVDQNTNDVDVNPENVDINSENADINAQNILKESILNESKIVNSLPLNNGEYHLVREADVKRYKDTYPKLDVLQELKKMHAWLDANPKKRKTPNGIEKFINSWLSRQKDPVHEKGGKVESGHDFIAAMARGKES